MREKIIANRFFPFVFLALVVFISTYLVWTPFIIHRPDLIGLKLPDRTFQVVKANFDGPLYIIVAKTWYDQDKIEPEGKGSIIDTKLKAFHGKRKKLTGSSVSAGFDLELLYVASKMNLKIKEVPVAWRHVETKNVNFIRDSIEGISDILMIKYYDFSGAYQAS